jgi:hypothetical protein
VRVSNDRVGHVGIEKSRYPTLLSPAPHDQPRLLCIGELCDVPTGTALVGGVSKGRPLAVIRAARKRDTAAETKRSARSEVSTSIANFDSGRIALCMNSGRLTAILKWGAVRPASTGIVVPTMARRRPSQPRDWTRSTTILFTIGT